MRAQPNRNHKWVQVLREAKPGVSNPGGFPLFFGERSRLCRGPFRDCSSWVPLIGRERGKGQIGKILGESPGKSGKSRKKSGKSQKIYTEQMDAEGLGRGLLLTSLATPRKSLKADCRYCDGISRSANPASTFKLSQCRHCKERLVGPSKGFWVTSGSLSPKTAASICLA